MYKALLTIVVVFLTLSCSKPQEQGLSVNGQWIREAPPGMKMMAGYATLKNCSDKAINIIGVKSDTFSMIEMHTTKVVDGTARMIEQEKLIIPAKGELSLSPGGYHLMLMMPIKQLKAGDHVNMTITLQDGKKIPVDFEVKKGGDMPEH